jgi:hypothetical protein
MDLVAFKRTLRYQRIASPAQIVADLDELRLFDRGHEALERRWRRLFIAALVALFLSLFIGLRVGLAGGGGAIGFLPLALAVLAVVAAVRWRRWAKFNLADERYQALATLCGLVRADMPSDGTLDVSLDFSRTERADLMQGERARGRWKCKLYVQPWLRARGRFVDGTRFDIRASERLEVRTCWARGRSGKTKHKRKVKGGAVLDVSLAPKTEAGRAGDLAAQGPALQQAVKLPPEARLVRGQAAADHLELRAWVARQPPGAPPLEHTLAMMLLGLYQVIGRAQEQRRGAT